MLIVTATPEVYAQGRHFIQRLAYASGVTFAENAPADVTGMISVVTHNATAYLPLSELVDIAAELERIAKEKEKAENGLRIVEQKLSNEKFVYLIKSEKPCGRSSPARLFALFAWNPEKTQLAETASGGENGRPGALPISRTFARCAGSCFLSKSIRHIVGRALIEYSNQRKGEPPLQSDKNCLRYQAAAAILPPRLRALALTLPESQQMTAESSASGRDSLLRCYCRRGADVCCCGWNRRSWRHCATRHGIFPLCRIGDAAGGYLRPGRLSSGTVRHGGDEGRRQHQSQGSILRSGADWPEQRGIADDVAPAFSGTEEFASTLSSHRREAEDPRCCGTGAAPFDGHGALWFQKSLPH